VPFTEFAYELGTGGRHSESACYFCRRRQKAARKTVATELVQPVFGVLVSQQIGQAGSMGRDPNELLAKPSRH